MPTETNQATRDSGSKKWLMAVVPALAIIAFIVYSAVSQGRKAEAENPDPTATESGK